MTLTLFNDAPLIREDVLRAERELAETIRALDRRAKRMSAVTTTDAEELTAFYRHHPSMRAFPKLRATDKFARCRGCRGWVLSPGSRGGAGRPPVAVGRVGAELVCGGCVPAPVKAGGYAV